MTHGKKVEKELSLSIQKFFIQSFSLFKLSIHMPDSIDNLICQEVISIKRFILKRMKKHDLINVIHYLHYVVMLLFVK